MINVFVVRSSAVLIPSTAGSATTGSAGFLERTALWTRHLVDKEGVRADWCGDWRADYF